VDILLYTLLGFSPVLLSSLLSSDGISDTSAVY
jgi:hypothetical protein